MQFLLYLVVSVIDLKHFVLCCDVQCKEQDNRIHKVEAAKINLVNEIFVLNYIVAMHVPIAETVLEEINTFCEKNQKSYGHFI